MPTLPIRIKCKGSRKTVPTRMDFKGKLSVKAAKAKGKTPEIVLIAYTGKPMTPMGFSDKVIVDLNGARFEKKTTPIIGDHDTQLRIGHSTRQAIVKAGQSIRTADGPLEGPLIYARGVPSSGMGVARGFVEDASNGFPFQTSIGADILDAYYVDEGEKAVVNGKTWKGPLIVATKVSIAELSVTVLGADRDTSATIAASRRNSQLKEIFAMSFLAWLKKMGHDPSKMTAKAKQSLRARYNEWKELTVKAKRTATKTPAKRTVKAKRAPADPPAPKHPQRISASDPTTSTLRATRKTIAQEQARVDGLNTLFAKFADDVEKVKYMGKELRFATFKTKAIENGLTVDQAELVLLKASLSVKETGPAIHVAQQIRDMGSEPISAAIVMQCGRVPAKKTQQISGEEYGYEVWYKDQTLEAASNRQLRNLSLHQLFDLVNIQANGHSYSGNRKTDDFIRATRESMMKIRAGWGPTTMNLTTVFEDSANKILWANYQSQNTAWQEIAQTINVDDFKTRNLYRLGSTGAYRLVGVDGQLEHGGFTETKYTHGLDTYGKIVGLDRRHLINDDMGAFTRIMADLGIEAAKTMEELVWLLLMGSLTTLFPTDNSKKNYISGATSNLSIEGLTQMMAQWGNQVDSEGSPILVPASKIIVGTNNEILARQIYNQTKIEIPLGATAGKREFMDNPFARMFNIVVSPYLNNVAIKQRVSKINKGSAIPNQTQTGWLMAADPNNPAGATILVSLLNGNRLPVLESADAPFDVLGMQWRAYHDFGVDEGDPAFMAFSKGAA